MDLGSFISSKGCECLNESDEHTLEHGLSSKGGYLESDCDEQVINNTLLIYCQRIIFHRSYFCSFWFSDIFTGIVFCFIM
jgi:hypothetical protein